jgi:hypothetical protein
LRLAVGPRVFFPMNRSTLAALGFFVSSCVVVAGCSAPSGASGEDEGTVETSDQELGSCSAASCGACTALASCGWGDGRCRRGTRSGPSSGRVSQWAWISNYCPGYGGGGCSGGCGGSSGGGSSGGGSSSGGSSGGGSSSGGSGASCVASDCATCTGLSSCGWGDGRCREGNASGPTTGTASKWAWTSGSCPSGGSSGGGSSGGSSGGGGTVRYWGCNVDWVWYGNVGGVIGNHRSGTAVGRDAISAEAAQAIIYNEYCVSRLASPSTVSCAVTGCGICQHGMSPSTCANE